MIIIEELIVIYIVNNKKNNKIWQYSKENKFLCVSQNSVFYALVK